MSNVDEPYVARTPSHFLVPGTLYVAVCIAVADWLFYDWPGAIGISLPIFLAVIAGLSLAQNGIRAPRTIQVLMVLSFFALLIAQAENVSVLSILMGVVGTASFVFVMCGYAPADNWQVYFLGTLLLPVRGPWQFTLDLRDAFQRKRRANPGWFKIGSLIAWIVPVYLSAVFICLFASANPVIEQALRHIDLGVLIGLLDPWRMAFWTLILFLVWPLIFRHIKHKPRVPKIEVAEVFHSSAVDHLLGAQAMSRSLIIFNLLFALQTGLDIVYLWGGASLPDGMTHAEYAHRGAYPLIVTALLAAAFALVAMRRGGPANDSISIRPLVLAWIAQNVVLVGSSILRLDLYVSAFSLTYLRFAAFVWMVLVAAGLVLMLIQIAWRKSNSWLLSANALALAAVLYGCCFVNVPRLLAFYNLAHCREINGTGPALDRDYLVALGPQSLPALEFYVKNIPDLKVFADKYRRDLADGFSQHAGNWRAWTFRTWRLREYLDKNPVGPADHRI